MSQTVRITAPSVNMQGVSEDDEEETAPVHRPARPALLGPVAVTLDVCASHVWLESSYTLQHSPGAPLSPACEETLLSSMQETQLDGTFPKPSARKDLIAANVEQRSTLVAGGDMRWEGHGTDLPLGFSAVRMETNRLECYVNEWLPYHDVRPGELDIKDPVRTLCRALRLAPACYRSFEIAPYNNASDELHVPLQIKGCGHLTHLDGQWTTRWSTADFDSIVDLAAVMQRFAAAECLDVRVSLATQSIIVRRSGDELATDVGYAQ